MLINSEAKRQRRLNKFERDELASLRKVWKKKGSHKGDALFLRIQQLTGDGDFLESDWGNGDYYEDNEY